ncbi:hypothetical protein UNDKW_4057 [Undibacterium sp. KW1]|nr:hypothetical protein UNDKW_4057 [Undibacterium sp. KW1]
MLTNTRLAIRLMAATGSENRTISNPRKPLQSSAMARLGRQHVRPNKKNADIDLPEVTLVSTSDEGVVNFIKSVSLRYQ